MTGFMTAKFRYNCADRGVCYNATLPDLSDLFDRAFPRGISPTDVDAMVEVNDHFLFLEFKKQGVDVPNGQRYALRLLSTRERVTVVIAENAEDDGFRVRSAVAGDWSTWSECTRAELHDRLVAWAARADAAGRSAA